MNRSAWSAVLLAVLAPSLAAAGDLVAETAAVHAHDRPVATPMALSAPVAPVTTQTVEYALMPDGSRVEGYLATPKDAGPGTPGLLVIHEWWGLNDNIRGITERLAAEGYVALAVDLYGGEAAADPKAAMRLMGALQGAPEQANANLRQAFAFLEAQTGGGRVGVIGWCLGGQWSLRTALLLPEAIDATVIYYGSLVTDAEALAPLGMPVLGNFAENDPLIPLDQVARFEATLRSLGKSVDVKVYADARHAFSNPSGTAYDEAAAKDAWARSLAFLARHLKAPDRG